MVERLGWVKNRKWSLNILDEAQAIKNRLPGKPAPFKALGRSRRIVLDGTPVRKPPFRSVSIFDFLNPASWEARRFPKAGPQSTG